MLLQEQLMLNYSQLYHHIPDRTISRNVVKVPFRHCLNIRQHTVILRPIYKTLHFIVSLVIKTIN